MKKLYFYLFLPLIIFKISCTREFPSEQISLINSGEILTQNEEPCPYLDDADCDSVPDNIDNCPFVSNPLQEDSDEDGLGDACDPDYNPNPPVNPPTYNYVTGVYYFENYCNSSNYMSNKCGLARGIKEVLEEIQPLIMGYEAYDYILKYYEITNEGNALNEISKEVCDTIPFKCYKAIRTIPNDYIGKLVHINYLNGKLAYADDLILNFPHLQEYYEAYKQGCVAAFWFDENSLPIFEL